MNGRTRKTKRPSVASGLNVAIRARAERDRQKVLELLAEHETMTNREIGAHLGYNAQQMRQRLATMMVLGQIKSELVPSDTCPFIAVYSLGEGSCKAEISQRIVSKWKPEPIKHEPLLAAFFGINNNEGMI